MMEAFTGNAPEWNAIIRNLPESHLLQTWEWAEIKSSYGWKPMPFVWKRKEKGLESIVAAAMILKRTVLNRSFAARLCILYIPKGPLLDWSEPSLNKLVLDDLQGFAKKQGAIFLKLDPDVVLGSGIPGSEDAYEREDGQRVISEFKRRGWLFSSDQIQFRNTVLVDVSANREQMLARMKQKTRYNIRLAEKKGVRLRIGELKDLPLLFKMYAETSVRDGFVIRDEGYYRAVWETFMKQPDTDHQPFAEPLMAEVNGEPVAAIFVFYFAGRAYYLYGMSLEAHREKMPNYLLQWEAICWAKSRGCSEYDLWGIPDMSEDELELAFSSKGSHEGLWGVYRFKRGFGGTIMRSIGAWDRIYYPSLYQLYLQMMKLRGRQED